MTTERTPPLRPVPVDPELADVLARPFTVAAIPAEEPIARERRRRREWHIARRRPGTEGEPATIAGVDCRVHAVARPRAVVLWLHGGGWLYGEAAGDEAMLSRFARDTGTDVVAVDYRLAPEHPHPAPLEDAFAVYRHLAARGLPVVVAGASAGAALAAGLCLFVRDHGEALPVGQLLISPPLDDRATEDDEGPLDRRGMDGFWRSYLQTDVPDAYAVPARAETLAGLPPAHVLTTSADPMRVEGWRYALRLVEDGVAVTARFIPGGYHGFEYEAPDTRLARRAADDAIAAIRDFLAAPPASPHVLEGD